MTSEQRSLVYNRTLDFVNTLESSDSKKIIGSNIKFYLKYASIVVLISSFYYLSYFFPDSLLSYVATFFLSLSIAHMGMTVFHELGHRAIMKGSNSLGDFMYYLTCSVSGYSGSLWRHKHNSLHHIYTNVSNGSEDMSDPDVTEQPINMTSDPSFNKFYQGYQHLYAWFLYPFLALSMQIQSLKHFITRMTKQDRFIYMLCQVGHFSMFFVLPLVLTNSLTAIAIKHANGSATASFTLAMIFQLAHIVDNVPVIAMTEAETKKKFESEEFKASINAFEQVIESNGTKALARTNPGSGFWEEFNFHVSETKPSEDLLSDILTTPPPSKGKTCVIV